MGCGINGLIAVERRAMLAPSWSALQGLDHGGWLDLPRATGWYNLYRGASEESIDYDVPVGQALAGSTEISEFPALHPTGTGTYVYAIKGAGPGGHETDPHATAFYQIDYTNGERDNPAPAAPVSFSASPYRDGQAHFVVVVDQSLGRVPVDVLRCYNDGGLGGSVDYGTQVGADVPLSTDTGRHVLQFVIDPALVHGADVGWSVRAVSADGVEEENTDVVYAAVDSEGPPALSDIVVECA